MREAPLLRLAVLENLTQRREESSPPEKGLRHIGDQITRKQEREEEEGGEEQHRKSAAGAQF